MSAHPRPTRRAVLLGALVAAVSACRPHRTTPAATPAPDADVDALQVARADELALIADYDAVIARTPKLRSALAAERRAHAAHLAALDAALPAPTSSPSPGSTPTPSARTDGDLDAALRASAARLRTAAVAAHEGGSAALLASIAASHAAHAGRLVVHFSSSVSL